MDLTEGHGELVPIGTVRDHPFNDIEAKPLVDSCSRFLRWVGHSDVFRAEPYLVANIVLWGLMLVNIVELGYVVSCLDQCSSCLISCLGHPGCKVVQRLKLGLTNRFKPQLWPMGSCEGNTETVDEATHIQRYSKTGVS